MTNHRDIIRNRMERRKRQNTSSYVKFITQIIIAQSCIRRYLAKKRYLILQEEERNTCAIIIQLNWKHLRLKKTIKERISARKITRFIRNVPIIREYRLNMIRRSLARVKINLFLNRCLRERRERRETEERIEHERLLQEQHQERQAETQLRMRREQELTERYNRLMETPTLPGTPPGERRVEFRTRLNEFIRQRDERIYGRDTRMQEIRTRISTITNNIQENIERHEAVFRRNNITTRPTGNILNRVPRQIPAINRQVTTPTFPPAPVVPPTPRLNIPPLNNDIRPNPITHRLPTFHQTNEARILEIERDLQNPMMRRIYQENRIMLPTGERVMPARNGGIVLQPSDNSDPTFFEPESSTKVSCPICMEDVGINRTIKFKCNHTFCKLCLRELIKSALNNISELPLRCPLFSNGCETIVEPSENGIRQLLSLDDYNKFERLTILKQHVPDERLKYCPNSRCQMPYEFFETNIPSEPPETIEFRFFTTCFDCNTHICTYCNDNWHEGMSCKEFQNRATKDNEETSKYIQNYCKRCPNCNVVVQKIQTREQEMYEKRTGMAGGTSECHHVTCDNCKRDFCWTCLQLYQGARYYHDNCPNVDCIIDFIGGYPSISHLPFGKIKNIKMIIYDGDNVIEEKIYQVNNTNRILDNPNNYKLQEDTVLLHCSNDGIVNRLQGFTGNYAFRQQAKFC